MANRDVDVEYELILLLLSPRLTPPRAARIRALLAHRPDWHALLDAAEWHGVLPLLTQNALAACPDALPASLFNRLQLSRDYVARANRTLALELVRIVALLRRADIEAVGFKGPALAAGAYGNLALRLFGDLDILVRKRDWERAQELLLAEGYEVEDFFGDEGDRFFTRITGADYHRAYKHPRTGTIVELHWQLYPRVLGTPLDSDDLWRRLRPTRVLSATLSTLSPEDQVLHLAVHGCKHLWDRLRYVCDVAACIERFPALQWQELINRAIGMHSERMLLVALNLSRRVLDVSLPQSIVRAIDDDGGVVALTEELTRRLRTRDTIGGRFGEVEKVRLWTRMRSRRRDQVAVSPYLLIYLWSMLKPHEKDRQRVPLPARLDWLHWIIRPARLIATLGFLGLGTVLGRVGRRLKRSDPSFWDDAAAAGGSASHETKGASR